LGYGDWQWHCRCRDRHRRGSQREGPEGKIVPGYDFVNGDPEPWDDHGHGTRIAAVIAAAANNGYGGAGVAYDAQVMPLKALNNTGSGRHAWISKAIVWATDHGADIINLSIGGPYQSQTLQDAVNYAWEHGVVLVAAAGNENTNLPAYPAAYDPVLAVAGTTRDQQRAGFSKLGRLPGHGGPGHQHPRLRGVATIRRATARLLRRLKCRA